MVDRREIEQAHADARTPLAGLRGLGQSLRGLADVARGRELTTDAAALDALADHAEALVEDLDTRLAIVAGAGDAAAHRAYLKRSGRNEERSD